MKLEKKGENYKDHISIAVNRIIYYEKNNNRILNKYFQKNNNFFLQGVEIQ